jgi:hypothetical protein
MTEGGRCWMLIRLEMPWGVSMFEDRPFEDPSDEDVLHEAMIQSLMQKWAKGERGGGFPHSPNEVRFRWLRRMDSVERSLLLDIGFGDVEECFCRAVDGLAYEVAWRPRDESTLEFWALLFLNGTFRFHPAVVTATISARRAAEVSASVLAVGYERRGPLSFHPANKALARMLPRLPVRVGY